MRAAVLGGILVLGGTIAFAQPGAAVQGASSAAIKQVADEYVKAVQAGDAKAVAALYTETATEMPPNEPAVKGRAAIEAYYQKLLTSGPKMSGFTLEHTETQESGDTGYDVGTFSETLTLANGQTVNNTGKYVVIAKRTSGAWKIAYAIYNSDRPAQPPQ
jgi:uncharacterized protein (TIGR02246 family)